MTVPMARGHGLKKEERGGIQRQLGGPLSQLEGPWSWLEGPEGGSQSQLGRKVGMGSAGAGITLR